MGNVKWSESLLNIERQYTELIEDWHQEWCEGNEWHRGAGRKGIFSASLTIWLMMLQAMTGSSLSGTLVLLQQGFAELVLKHNPLGKRAKFLSSNNSGLSRAKSRLPLSDVEDATEAINTALAREHGDERLYGYRTVAIDGTNLILERTPDLEELYPRGRNDRGRLNHPEVVTVFVTDVVSGVTGAPEYGPARGKNATSEQALSAKVIEKLEPNTLIIGDKNFGVFSVLSHAKRHGHQVLVRLQENRAKKFLDGEKKSGPIDKQVTWRMARWDQPLADEDPPEISGRFVRARLEEPGFRPMELYLFTTIDLPVPVLVELYGKRVNVETDIRYLKDMFKLERLYSRTPESLAKEIIVRFCAFNLLRRVLADTARLVGLLPREISFTHAVRYLPVYAVKFREATSDVERQEVFERFLTVMRQGRLPKRKSKRHEPRAVTHKGARFPTMEGSRSEARKKITKNGNN